MKRCDRRLCPSVKNTTSLWSTSAKGCRNVAKQREPDRHLRWRMSDTSQIGPMRIMCLKVARRSQATADKYRPRLRVEFTDQTAATIDGACISPEAVEFHIFARPVVAKGKSSIEVSRQRCRASSCHVNLTQTNWAVPMLPLVSPLAWPNPLTLECRSV